MILASDSLEFDDAFVIVVTLFIVGVLGCCTAMCLAHAFSCHLSCRPDIGAVPHYRRGGDHRSGRAQWRGIDDVQFSIVSSAMLVR